MMEGWKFDFRKVFNNRWKGFCKIFPKDRNIDSKKYASSIEQNKSNTHYYLAKIIRGSRVVSKSEDMLYASSKLLFSPSFAS